MQKLEITSPAFEHGGVIPIEHTGYGEDISPELRISHIPAGAQSIAVIMDDDGHPLPHYNHWVIWNLPVTEVIPEHIPHGAELMELGGAVQGKGYGKHCYRGPKPPFNWSHNYQYHVYVLHKKLKLPANARKRALKKAMEGHILAYGSIVGRYR